MDRLLMQEYPGSSTFFYILLFSLLQLNETLIDIDAETIVK